MKTLWHGGLFSRKTIHIYSLADLLPVPHANVAETEIIVAPLPIPLLFFGYVSTSGKGKPRIALLRPTAGTLQLGQIDWSSVPERTGSSWHW